MKKVLTRFEDYGSISLALSHTAKRKRIRCASGGIGRLAGFRCQCSQGRAGSTPASRTKKKDTLKACLSFWVPPPGGRLHPSVFQCSGPAEPPLRNSRPQAGNLRATRRAAQKGRWAILPQRSCQSQISILTAPSCSPQAAYRLRRVFSFPCKTHRALIEAAPRFQLRPAALERRLPGCPVSCLEGGPSGQPVPLDVSCAGAAKLPRPGALRRRSETRMGPRYAAGRGGFGTDKKKFFNL